MARDVWWFQPRTIKAVDKAWADGHRSVVLVSPPGSGKTEMAKRIATRDWAPDDVAFVSHTRAIKRNAAVRVGVASYTVQELLSSGGFPRGKRPKFIIWDECHHSAGDKWGTVLDMAKGAWVLGLTATPQRFDGKALDRFDHMVVAAHYSELLMAGTIVPWRVLEPGVYKRDGEPDPVQAYMRFGQGTKAIFYCKSIAQADDCAPRLRELGVKAEAWHSHSAHRDEILSAFERGALRCIVTVDALSEGFDVPDSNCVVLASKCLHVGTYLQKTGRGGRRKAGKTHSLLLDLSGANARHGSPTEDRVYSIKGSGIQRSPTPPIVWDYDRKVLDQRERQRKDLDPYDADLVVAYDWQAPSKQDKRRQLGWLREFAGRRGWGEDVAKAAFEQLFGREEGDE